ncbi:putative GATA transcription factor 22 [Cornus florida]|uniref:putative GATA transcription factor 22 n=1 Tax=Cornus florida TaxID=4283 RepID=UPI002899CB60|nr:putative GATA transcription factor 22 [Cornus florida]
MNEDQHHPNLQASSSSSFSYHIFFQSTQDQSGYYHPELKQQQEVNNLAAHEVSYDDVENESDSCLKLSLWKKEYTNENQISENNISVKWMSSKMRLMQKMKNSDRTLNFQDQKQPSSPIETENSSNSSSNNSNIPVRVCADCNTTKTPLWRSGPRGPKSLCNACGIRQRKARRAMAVAAAAAAANGTFVATESSSSMKTKVHHKDNRSNKGHVSHYKKRSKLGISSDHARKKLCFEDFLISVSKNLAFHSVFPQDEKEAAILLMALSCGIVRD